MLPHNPYNKLRGFFGDLKLDDQLERHAVSSFEELNKSLVNWIGIPEKFASKSIAGKWLKGRDGTNDWRHLFVCAHAAKKAALQQKASLNLVENFVDALVADFGSVMMGVWDTFRFKSALNTGIPEKTIRHSYTLFMPLDKSPERAHRFHVRAFGADQIWVGEASAQGSSALKLLKFSTADKEADLTDINTTMGYTSDGVFRGVFLGTAPHKSTEGRSQIPIVASRTVMVRNPVRTREMFLDHSNWVEVNEINKRREIGENDFAKNESDVFGQLDCKTIHSQLLGPNDYGGPRLYVV